MDIDFAVEAAVLMTVDTTNTDSINASISMFEEAFNATWDVDSEGITNIFLIFSIEPCSSQQVLQASHP